MIRLYVVPLAGHCMLGTLAPWRLEDVAGAGGKTWRSDLDSVSDKVSSSGEDDERCQALSRHRTLHFNGTLFNNVPFVTHSQSLP